MTGFELQQSLKKHVNVHGSVHVLVSARPHWEQVAVTILWFVPVAVDTVEHCTPDDGRVWGPKHVE